MNARCRRSGSLDPKSSTVHEETEMEKYISTNTYFRQHEQCIPSTSFFEAKMNKLHEDDISVIEN